MYRIVMGTPLISQALPDSFPAEGEALGTTRCGAKMGVLRILGGMEEQWNGNGFI